MEAQAQVFSEDNQKVAPKSLLEVDVNNESTALKIMINYLTNAQKAGLFGFQESAKIGKHCNNLQESQKEEKVKKKNC